MARASTVVKRMSTVRISPWVMTVSGDWAKVVPKRGNNARTKYDHL
jgi:hypothetical protein